MTILAAHAFSPRPFARCAELRRIAAIEVLIPDFQGLDDASANCAGCQPDVLNHNTESVPRLYRAVRSGARYERTLRLAGKCQEVFAGDGDEEPALWSDLARP